MVRCLLSLYIFWHVLFFYLWLSKYLYPNCKNEINLTTSFKVYFKVKLQLFEIFTSYSKFTVLLRDILYFVYPQKIIAKAQKKVSGYYCFKILFVYLKRFFISYLFFFFINIAFFPVFFLLKNYNCLLRLGLIICYYWKFY